MESNSKIYLDVRDVVVVDLPFTNAAGSISQCTREGGARGASTVRVRPIVG